MNHPSPCMQTCEFTYASILVTADSTQGSSHLHPPTSSARFASARVRARSFSFVHSSLFVVFRVEFPWKNHYCIIYLYTLSSRTNIGFRTKRALFYSYSLLFYSILPSTCYILNGKHNKFTCTNKLNIYARYEKVEIAKYLLLAKGWLSMRTLQHRGIANIRKNICYKFMDTIALIFNIC